MKEVFEMVPPATQSGAWILIGATTLMVGYVVMLSVPRPEALIASLRRLLWVLTRAPVASEVARMDRREILTNAFRTLLA
jgi:hypothetical protein